jgi:two-component system cell cycle sensor histidine kinase/response regulator CckA
MSEEAVARALGALVKRERAAIVRSWQRRLRLLAYEPTEALAPFVDELALALETRGAAAAPVYAELASQRSARRDGARTSARDAGRSLSALHQAVLLAWSHQPDARAILAGAAVLAELFDEAVGATAAEHTRLSGLSEVRAGSAARRLALDEVEDAVLVCDGDGQATYVNRAAARLWGALPSADARLAVRALRSGREEGPERVRTQPPGLEPLVYDVRAVPLTSNGERVGAVQLGRDRSDEEQRDAALERADRELAALHGRLLRVGHDRSMGDLATGIGLALNNELNALALSLRLLRGELPDHRPDANRHVEAIDLAVQRSAVLVSRLQELATRRVPGTARAIDLNASVMEALDLVRPELTGSARDRPTRVDARLGAVPAVLAQGPELRELLCKLLISARDQLTPGGVLQVWTRPSESDRTRAEVVLAHPTADEPSSDEEDAQLQLEAAREQARGLDGELTREQSDGRTLFRLTLPFAPSARPELPSVPPLPRPRAPQRVLVVDDDAGNRETLTELLALSGHEVDDAATSEEALQAVERRTYDVALLDLAMPGMNGLELGRRLRARHPTLRIALVTGWEPSATTAAEEHGTIEAIFRKPLELHAIQAFLESGPPSPDARRM